MVHLVVKGRGGQVEGEDTGNAPVDAVLRRHEFAAGIVAHGVENHLAVAVFVDLWNQILKRQTFQNLAVALHLLERKFFSDFQTKRVVVFEVPIARGEIQP